ncbi:MAG: sulfite exporter TauE/SafE family protein [Bacteroidia bacterium]|nr:MAG: sulfite exporter TauE/SafE family protein [Bacteroidia bacterium]
MESAIELNYYWLPLIGFIVGLVATMVGGNGAFFFPPTLILLFGISPHVAIATSLAAVIPIGLIGSAEHYRRNNINLPVGLVFGGFGMLGAVVGALISGYMEAVFLIKAFGVYSVLLGLLTMRVPKNVDKAANTPPEKFSHIRREKLPLMISIGLIAGIVAGLFGTSGTAPVLAGLFLLHFPVKLVIGTSVMIVFMNAIFGFGGHLLVGEIDLELIFLLGSGAAIGAFFGPRLLVKIHPERKEGKFRYAFAAIIIALGLLLIFR